MKKKLFIANWKLNHTRKTASLFFSHILDKKVHNIDIAIAPTAPMLDFCYQHMLVKGFLLAAQNVFYADSGAYTGEYSALQLSEIGVRYCIIGHSERRKLFHETDDDIVKKVWACCKENIVPVICVGENQNDREQGIAKDVVKKQVLSAVANNISKEIIIAYEPVWAIGSGQTATPNDISDIHKMINDLLLDNNFSDSLFRLIYGGSITPENIDEICAMPYIDGVLVGGASLQSSSFLAMVAKLSSLS